jgi:hypothetical protein
MAPAAYTPQLHKSNCFNENGLFGRGTSLSGMPYDYGRSDILSEDLYGYVIFW